MIDCYRILGISPHASQDDIRAAFIAKMKVLHPDATGPAGEAEARASEVTAAYWQLRTSDRRAEHDRRLFASTVLAEKNRPGPAPRRRLLPVARRAPAGPRRREQTSRMLMAAGVGLVALALAAPAGLFWIAHVNPIEPARASAAGTEARAVAVRRPLDGAMRAAAADDFASVLRDFGIEGARTFSRRCIQELTARASVSMLDYCIAFDDAAANWERPRKQGRAAARLFADEQRSSAYREAAETVREPEVRGAMLQEARYFAGDAPTPEGGGGAALAEVLAL